MRALLAGNLLMKSSAAANFVVGFVGAVTALNASYSGEAGDTTAWPWARVNGIRAAPRETLLTTAWPNNKRKGLFIASSVLVACWLKNIAYLLRHLQGLARLNSSI